ncbi:amidohydrolase family protein [Crenothrix polyspora]|uniref:Amidohydrolase 2 n=1 Tax=Crenothrix polyspora TaxID=360316 RepID=A0A1R4HIU7_9GAMM|nr:amidohydrolase family protein [Crenothrix polyspora]SJM96133.1 Amidohydrolase 2 [Crenothrix polyspora]
MSDWLSKKQLKLLRRASEDENLSLPIPTQVISDGENMPIPQTKQQAQVEALIKEQADVISKSHGVSRREFLRTSSAFAVAFGAMNQVFGGDLFGVGTAEASEPEAAEEYRSNFRDQFIFDIHTHHVHEDYAWPNQLGFLAVAKAAGWAKELENVALDIKNLKFAQYVKDIFFDSDTSMAVLNNSYTWDPIRQLITENQVAASRDHMNALAQKKRVLAHGTIWPSNPRYLDDMDRQAEELKVDGWKGYTVGDPWGSGSDPDGLGLRLGEDPKLFLPWRLDDENIAYPAYEKALKYGIKNICIHKGMMPAGDYQSFPNWQNALVDDVGQAARDWPELNFIIFHSALRPLLDASQYSVEFEATGKLPWVDELAAIPKQYGVNNVYAEIGLSFAMTTTTYPRVAAAMLGKLIQGMGADHVIWGTDSLWFGGPQWQIEAFRRIEIPLDIQEKFGFAPLGKGNSKVKNAIFGLNAARLYNLDIGQHHHDSHHGHHSGLRDRLTGMKDQYLAAGGKRDNVYHGQVYNRKRG